MRNPAVVPPTIIKPEFAENNTHSRKVKAGRVTLNVTSTFGNEKLSDILYQIASEKIEECNIGTASCLHYNNSQAEVKITKPALFSQFGGRL